MHSGAAELREPSGKAKRRRGEASFTLRFIARGLQIRGVSEWKTFCQGITVIIRRKTFFFQEGSLDSFSHLDDFRDGIKTLFLFRIYLTVCGES